MGGACSCGKAEPEFNPDGSEKELPPLEQQARDPEELRKAARAMDAAGMEVLLRRMRRAAINSGTTKEESTPDQQGNTALHLAAAANWLTGCRMLVLYGASQKVRSASGAGGKTPLHVAVEAGKRKVTAYLLELEEPPPAAADPDNPGAPPPPSKPWRAGDINATDSSGRSAVLTAFLTGRQQFTGWFLAACSAYNRTVNMDVIDNEGEHAALCCARYGWWDLLKDKVLPGLRDSARVINTANKQGETVLGWLLKYCVAGEMTTAQVAAWIDRLPGLDVSVASFKERIPPLCMAVAAGDQGLVDKVLAMGLPTLIGSKDAMGRTALHYAAAHGQKDLALHLVSLGAGVTAADKTKATPYHLAATRGYGEVSQALLEGLPDLQKAAALMATNSAGYNMAHLSLMSKKCDDASQAAILKVLGMMDEAVYALPVQDKRKDTPLMLAISSHLDLVVQAMLSRGVSCNQGNMQQESPLARNLMSVTKVTAARDARIFDMLIKAGAVVDSPNPATHPVMAVCRSDVNEFSALAVQTLEDLSSGKLVVTPPPPPPQKPNPDGTMPDPPPEPAPPGPLDWNKEDDEGRGPMSVAAAHNNTFIIKYLAAKHPELVNKQADKNGQTALMSAASNASCTALRVLLDLGADVTLVDKDGHDALWHAMRLDKPDTLDCAAMLLLKGAKTRMPGVEGESKGGEYLDITGEGWLHRAVRYGAVDFIKLWARMGGRMGIQCTTPETADDMPGGNEVAAEQVDFLEEPLEGQEADAWEEEELEVDSNGEVNLKVDPNSKIAAAPTMKLAGPIAESVVLGCDGMSAMSFVSALKREDVQAWRKMGPKWFDLYCQDAVVPRDQDDPLYEEMQELIDTMAVQQRAGADVEGMGGINPYDVEYHVYEHMARQQRLQPQAVAEGAEVDRGALASRVGSWIMARTSSVSGDSGAGGSQQRTSSGGRLAAHQRALCEAAVMENNSIEAEVLQKVEADMGFNSLLLSGQDPLDPSRLIAARHTTLSRGCWSSSFSATSSGPGPIAEAQVHPERVSENGPERASAVPRASTDKASSLMGKAQASMARAGSSVVAGVDKVKKGMEKRVVNNDPYYAQVTPDDDLLYACRKYEGEPAYLRTAREASKPYSPEDLDARANEINARMSGYADKDKQADNGALFFGPSLRARNMNWWNRSLCPEEYPLKLGIWRRLDKKKEQAINAARARAPAAPGAKIKPRKKTALFGLPDMPSRPELLLTGALTYAVRLGRPDCATALLEVSACTVNMIDGYGYPALSYALCMLAREPGNKTLGFMVDSLLLSLPDGNLITRFRPVNSAQQRKDIVKFVKKRPEQFSDCWVDSNVVDKSFFAGGAMAPDEDAIIAKLYAKVLAPATGSEEVEALRRSARSVLGLCRADPLEPLVACVALGDVSRLAWLVRKCGAFLEAAWVHLPDIPTYYQGLLEKDVSTCLSVCSPLHIAVSMRKFELVRAVLDLGSDPNACGTPRQADTHNPWAYAAALDKVRERLQRDWRDELQERDAAAKQRQLVDQELLIEDSEARQKFTQASTLTAATPNSTGEGTHSEEEAKAAVKLRDRIKGGIMARMKKLKKLILSIEIPGFTRPHPWVTPLHLAARVGQADIAFLLVSRGALADGGVSRLFAKRTPLQEAIMYARANHVESNTWAPREHHVAMTKGVEASIPEMNGSLQAAQAQELISAALKSFYDPTVAALKAFAMTVRLIVSKLMDMRNRPIAHWDPALATAHVLLLSRAPVDVAETQTSIVLRDLMDNGSWQWLGGDVKGGINDAHWTYEAQLYTYRLKNSEQMGAVPMTRTADLKWYKFAKRFFTNRCDTAYFGAGVKALSAVYNQMCEASLVKATQQASERAATLKAQRKAILTAATKARKELQAAQAAQLAGSREAAAQQLGSPFIFDDDSFVLLMEESSEAAQARLEEAAKTAAVEAAVRAKLGDTTGADGGFARSEQLEGLMDAAAGALTGGGGGGGKTDMLMQLKDKVTEKAGDKASEKVQDRLDKEEDKKIRQAMRQGVQYRGRYVTPSCQPWQQPGAPPRQGPLAQAGSTCASKTSDIMRANMVGLAKGAAGEMASSGAMAMLDRVLTPGAAADVASGAAEHAEGLPDAADAVAGQLDMMGTDAGGWDLPGGGDAPSLDVSNVDIDGAVGAVGELVDGVYDLLDFA